MKGEAIAALIGAFIGAGGPIVTNFIHEYRQNTRRARLVSLAVAGEIAAVLETVHRRDYLAGIREAQAVCENGTVWMLKIRITRDYFPVVTASLSDLGILPGKLPALIPRFLTLSKSALEDFNAIESGHWGDRDAEALADGYRELGDIFEAALTAGAEIVTIVEQRYPS